MGAFKSKNKCKSKCSYSINHHIIYILDEYPQYQNEFKGIYNNFNSQNNSNCQSYLSNCQFQNDQDFMSKLGIDFPTLVQMIISASRSTECSRPINSVKKCKSKFQLM
jgi:hypothetical protein